MGNSLSNRFRVGEVVDFSLCDEFSKVHNHVFLKKDGGWGIASEEGEVIMPNHLSYPFQSRLGYIDDSLCVVKDVDTDLYGVISRSKAKEIIPFEYTYIETKNVEYPTGITEKRKVEFPFILEDGEEDKLFDFPVMKKELLFLVNKGGYITKEKNGCNYREIAEDGLWGIYKEDGRMLVCVRYYNIRIYRQFIECRSTDDYLNNDYAYDNSGCILSNRQYIGKIDLYTIKGNFIVGGVDMVAYHEDYIKLYVGIEYDTIKETRTERCFDGYEYNFDLYHNIAKFDDAACLILDKQFKPILKARSNWFDNKFHIGMTFKGKEDFCEKLGRETLLKGCSVDMQFFNKELLFLRYPDEQYIISEFKSMTEEVCSINICFDGHSEYVDIPHGTWEDRLIEDKVCVIAKLSNDGSVVWSHRVNEIETDDYHINLFYREGDKIGKFTENGFGELKYSAISKKMQPNGNLVVAIKEKGKKGDSFNPNFNQLDNSTIKYYEINEREELIRLNDNWNVFNPMKCNWFPENFKEDNGLLYDFNDYDYDDNSVGGWTRRELEDAADAAYEGYSRLELGLD